MTVLPKEAPANYVPAAAVIRRGQACPDLLGVKGVQADWRVDGESSRLNRESAVETTSLEDGRGNWNFWCSGKMRRYQKERR